jgi:Spy/CpxP family protein refolding chaperone
VRRAVFSLLFLVLVPALGHAQQQQGSTRRPSDPARRAAEQARRDSLEVEIVQKFIGDLTRELKLDATQRGHIERVLTESGARRRELMRTSGQLRGRMRAALREGTTADADFTRLLAEHDQLRVREHDLWRRDQDELARFLTPRQRTQFLIHWSNFQDKVREIIERRMREDRDKTGPPRSDRY